MDFSSSSFSFNDNNPALPPSVGISVPGETDLQRLSREISDMRHEITTIIDASKDVEKKVHDLYQGRNSETQEAQKKIDLIKLLLEQQLNEVNKLIAEANAEKFELHKTHSTLESELAQKEKEYAALLAARNQSEVLAELTRSVVELIGDTEAWQKARDYQKDVIFTAIQLFKDGKNGLLNADDMGLGKTFETIVSLMVIEKLFQQEYSRTPTILWLTKKSLVSSSPTEIRKWWPDRTVVPMKDIGTKELREFAVKTALNMKSVIVTNYEAVRTTPLIKNTEWDILVVDEVHKLKGGANSNGPTEVWKNVRDLSIKTKFMFFLSGTPMVNSPMEMWSYLHIFSPERFPTLKAFRRDFCEKSKVAGEFDLVVNPDKLLSGALRGQMVRRRMDEVEIEMPDFDIEDRVLEMGDNQRKVYEEMRKQFFVWIDQQEGTRISATAIIAQLNYLRQISVFPGMLHQKDAVTGNELFLNNEDSIKVDEVLDLVDDFQDQCIIGCTFNAPLFAIQKRLVKKGISCEVLTGANSGMTGTFEKRFQNRELDVFAMNIKMGAGMNLHRSPDDWRGGARYGITLDRWWTPADNDQFYRRIWRPGATHGVVIYNLHCDKSVDKFIEEKLVEKAKVIGSIAESSEVRPASDWKQYLEEVL